MRKANFLGIIFKVLRFMKKAAHNNT